MEIKIKDHNGNARCPNLNLENGIALKDHLNTIAEFKEHFNETIKVMKEQHDEEMAKIKKEINRLCAANAHNQILLKVQDSPLPLRETVKCIECNRMFREAKNLKRHIEEKHKNIKNFECLKCNKTFARRQHLQKHKMKKRACN